MKDKEEKRGSGVEIFFIDIYSKGGKNSCV